MKIVLLMFHILITTKRKIDTDNVAMGIRNNLKIFHICILNSLSLFTKTSLSISENYLSTEFILFFLTFPLTLGTVHRKKKTVFLFSHFLDLPNTPSISLSHFVPLTSYSIPPSWVRDLWTVPYQHLYICFQYMLKHSLSEWMNERMN